MAFHDQGGIKTFSFGGQNIRVLDVEGAPWFAANDVCRAIEVAIGTGGKPNVTMATKGLAPDERGIKQIYTPHGAAYPTNMLFVSESGLYKLIMRSDKPQAKPFQDWVTRDVLPAIRKDGGYILGEEKVATGEMSEDELLTRALLIAKNKMERLAAERDVLQTKVAAEQAEKALLIEDKSKLAAAVEADRPKVAVFNRIADPSKLHGIRETAISIGLEEKKFINRCIEKGILYRLGKDKVLMPHARYVKSKDCAVKWKEYAGKMRPTAFFTGKGLASIAKKVVQGLNA